tara:strand:- start:11038 stop:11703 length:666 start_codon:yes stop_codon:yes gene_type:complete
MKAFILAAGKGKRLKPITNNIPKPLIEIKGKPLLEWSLIKLRSAGVKEIVINLHYLGDQIVDYFGNGKKLDLKINYSFEKRLLGTGGALIQGKNFLNDSPFLLISGDLWTDYPFKRLLSKDLKNKAHLVLIKKNDKNIGDFNLLDSKISSDTRDREYTYSGISLIDPGVIPIGKASNKELWNDVLKPLVKENQITGEVFHGLVKNVNEVSDIEELDLAITE